MRDGDGDVAYSGPVVFLPEDSIVPVLRGGQGARRRRDGAHSSGSRASSTRRTASPRQQRAVLGVPRRARTRCSRCSPTTATSASTPASRSRSTRWRRRASTRSAAPSGKPLRLDLAHGQSARLPDGLGTVTFDGVSRWVKLQVSHTPGQKIALGGVVLAIIGLMGSLFIRPRRVWVRTRRRRRAYRGRGRRARPQLRRGPLRRGRRARDALRPARSRRRPTQQAAREESRRDPRAVRGVSNQAVCACAVVYFLALLAHLAQWAAGRKVRGAGRRSRVAAPVGGVRRRARRQPTRRRTAEADEPERMERFGRIGVALTVVGCVRAPRRPGRAAAWPRTRCGCPGETCTSSPSTGTWVVTVGYLLL